MGGKERYLAAQEIWFGAESTVPLPANLDADASADDRIIQTVQVQNVAKLRAKLRGARKLAFSILFDQSAQEK